MSVFYFAERRYLVWVSIILHLRGNLNLTYIAGFGRFLIEICFCFSLLYAKRYNQTKAGIAREKLFLFINIDIICRSRKWCREVNGSLLNAN